MFALSWSKQFDTGVTFFPEFIDKRLSGALAESEEFLVDFFLVAELESDHLYVFLSLENLCFFECDGFLEFGQMEDGPFELFEFLGVDAIVFIILGVVPLGEDSTKFDDRLVFLELGLLLFVQLVVDYFLRNLKLCLDL